MSQPGRAWLSRVLTRIQRPTAVAGLVAGDLSSALVPDDHRARPPHNHARLPGPDPLEVTRGQGVVPGGYGQPPDTGIE